MPTSAQKRETAERRHADNPAAGLKILLADDSAVARVFAARLLEFDGHSVELACNGREAMEAVRRVRYDVILLDLHMPEMDGIAATRALRAGGCALPIVAVSATASTDELQDCLDAGMNGTLNKPFTLEDFDAECRRLQIPIAMQRATPQN